jgi:hypothetical protein
MERLKNIIANGSIISDVSCSTFTVTGNLRLFLDIVEIFNLSLFYQKSLNNVQCDTFESDEHCKSYIVH